MKKLFVLILCITTILGGCGYSTNVEEQAFVVAVGIDKGETFPLKVTFVFANPGGSNSEEKSPSTPKPDMVTVEAPTVFSAVRKMDAIKSKALNLSHVKIAVFSDSIAQSGVKEYLSGFASSRDFRPNTYVCVTKGEAGEYLKSVKPAQETFIEKYYDNIMRKVAEDKVNEAYLYYLYFNTAEDFSGSLVPLAGVNQNQLDTVTRPDYSEGDDFSYEAVAGEILRDAENPAEILGCAIFKNDKMVGTLGSFRTDLARIIRNEYYPRNYSISYPESPGFITLRLLQQESPRIKSRIENGIPIINIRIPVSIEYVDAGDIENDKEKSDRFCKTLEEALDTEAKNLINTAQNEYECDFLGLGNKLKYHFPDLNSWKKWNWKEKYKNAQISIVFDVEYADFEEAN